MLRDYQIEICRKVNEELEAHRSVMMQMPTGTGKTVVLASLVKQYLNLDNDAVGHCTSYIDGCPVLIVAHRIELIEQTGAFLSHFGIDYGVIAGGKWPTEFKRVMVASIQTLSKKPVLDFNPSLVVIDEAHHALAKTYQMLWTAWPEAKFLGLTATPYRMSGDGFTDLFEVLVDSWSVKQFIADGWLSPYDYYSIRPDSEEQKEIDSLKKRGADGDFQMKELREKLDVRPSIERLYESFERFAYDKKGIVYAIDIAHAEHIAEFFREQGVAAYAISSKTPLPERKLLIEGFRKGASFEEKGSSFEGKGSSFEEKSSEVFENHPPSPSLPLKKGLHRFPLNPLSPQGTGDLKPGRPGLYSQTSSRPCGVARELPTQQSCDCLCAEGAAAQEGCDCLVQVLVSVDLFSEGFDCPDVEFIQMARPTLSLAKYLQMVGRGLRAHKGKACCTIIDNVGLYRAFGLPSADRDWNDAFCGYANERIKELWFLKIDTGWFPSSLLENRGDNVVKIVSHEGMTDQYKELDNTGFERMQNKDGRTVWRDRVNGVTFEHKPVVVDFSGLELSTEDGVMLYPRIASPLIDKDNGIHYNLLKMQVGDGILWKKRYVSLSNPARVYRLEETHQNGLRVFRDDWGNVYLQQDPDHSPVAETDVSREEMMSCCNEGLQRLRRINDDVKNNMRAALINKYPVMIIEETLSEEKLQRITLADRKMRSRTERWLDLKTDYVYSQKPEIIKRGWVELAQVDGLIYVRNIHGLSGWAFPNYDIRMDERLCVIGNVLVMRNRSVSVVYKIEKKSEDMTMFIVDNLLNRYMIINKPGMELEKHYLSK